MTGLGNARKDLAEAIAEAGYRVVEYVPNKISPPLVLISTGEPWIEESDTFDTTEFVVNLEVFIIAASGSNARQIESLETMIEKVILHLADWTITGVSAPYMGTNDQSEYLTCRLAVSNTFNLTG